VIIFAQDIHWYLSANVFRVGGVWQVVKDKKSAWRQLVLLIHRMD